MCYFASAANEQSIVKVPKVIIIIFNVVNLDLKG